MRFDHLAVRTGEEELGMAFHERLTIVSGLGHAERREMVELLLSALVGGRRESSQLRYVDGTGRVVLVDAEDGKVKFTFEDGTPAPDPLAPLGLDLAALRRISHVKGTDMDRLAAAAGGPVPAELDEARRTLAELIEQLEVADDAQRELEALRFELAAVDEQLRDVTAGAPRRQFARPRAAAPAGPGRSGSHRRASRLGRGRRRPVGLGARCPPAVRSVGVSGRPSRTSSAPGSRA